MLCLVCAGVAVVVLALVGLAWIEVMRVLVYADEESEKDDL